MWRFSFNENRLFVIKVADVVFVFAFFTMLFSTECYFYIHLSILSPTYWWESIALLVYSIKILLLVAFGITYRIQFAMRRKLWNYFAPILACICVTNNTFLGPYIFQKNNNVKIDNWWVFAHLNVCLHYFYGCRYWMASCACTRAHERKREPKWSDCHKDIAKWI